MIADQWVETSWRAQPGSFVSLMTLYESNFVRLGWLAGDLRAITTRSVSKVAADCDLYLTPLELSRYTSVYRLTYEFADASPVACAPAGGSVHDAVRDPDLEVCVYHDARLAEVRSFRGIERHPHLARLHSRLKRELDQRWTRNMMLNKWLEYCAERGITSSGDLTAGIPFIHFGMRREIDRQAEFSQGRRGRRQRESG